MNVYYITEYKYLDVTCPEIKFDKNSYIEEIKNLSPIVSRGCMSTLEDVSSRLEESNSEIKNLYPIVHGLVSLSNVLSLEKSREMMTISFNILTRAALTGNVDAMYGLTTTSFTPTKEEMAKILIIKGIDHLDLDFEQVKEVLSQKLEEDESEEAFVEVLEEMKHKSIV
ncbi:hypothetical protein H8356DRAFT_1674037 [Neocallimastix lanati (nom. inval.)]|uniref:Uncharacterized protein n=1 Tax=Neocallimastix californiae TaxID=1754190 RepID=A0A1Y2DFY0_9FUNG|nr:hypothetical protein H8356DRAFT_1674037 [Neocallimastix sp. JGI-2020a]ORY57605.1 hypothetical protein LY90DRAFT_644414 [Neocallimastix californiae]|eukprot:ORY57605.1 hypothetical protein LY90DRAFT_644414 [Neocallimastix californiae]